MARLVPLDVMTGKALSPLAGANASLVMTAPMVQKGRNT